MSGLDGTGTKFPNGVNVDQGELFIAGISVTPSAAELNTLKNITATTAELNAYSILVPIADANTLGSVYVVVPHAGNVIGLFAVNGVTNSGAKTVLLGKIGGVTITAPAWEIAITQAAGVASSVVPTAANAVAAAAVIEIAFDGGGTPVMPVQVTILISR